MNNIDLFYKILYCEDELEIVNLLQENAIWNDNKCWKYYGNNENNLSTILNQQSEPEAALNEKIVNSIDAILLRECKRENIDPESLDAPSSLSEAITLYKDNISKEDIQIYATGEKDKYPNIVIADYGEGQSPKYFEDTLLSLNSSNKLKIPFVQGKFNMGSTGVLPFCGTKNMQLILSKKDQKIKSDDKDSHLWSFTITRKNSSDQTRKSSVIEYMVIDGKVPTIDQKTLNILPNKKKAGATYSLPMESGTYIKLYNFHTKHKTTIKTNLFFKLSQLLPELPFEIFLADRREGFDTPSNKISTILKGNKVRMQMEGKLYKEFPICNTIHIDKQDIKIEMYLLKNLAKSNLKAFKSTETIVYTLNGQYHGYEPDTILNRKSISLDYIKRNILVYVDITNLNTEFRESLFMASRDRMRDSVFKKELLELVIDEIANNTLLQTINDEVRAEQLKDKTSNNLHIVKSLNKVMKKVSNIANLFDIGDQLNDINKIEKSKKRKEKFVGVDDPTFFELTGDYNILSPKEVELNKRFRITYKTDGKNDLFNNDEYKASFTFENEENIKFNYLLSLNNGVCSILISLEGDLKENQLITFNSSVKTKSNQFEHQFVVKLTKENTQVQKQSKKRDSEKENPKLNLPTLNDIYKKDWGEHGFDEKSVLEITGNDFYINLDNIFLKQHISNSKQAKEQIIEEYKSIFLMQGIAIQRQNQEIEDEDKKINVREVSSALAPVTFPTQMIIEDLRK